MLTLFTLLILSTGCDDKDTTTADSGLSDTDADTDADTDTDTDADSDTDTDTQTDQDGDGVSVADGDCDDGDASRYPGAPELCNDIDDDCDGAIDDDDDDTVGGSNWYSDSDGDGFGATNPVFVACVAPSTTVGRPGDCDDSDAAINPLATETCNGLDDDCDLLVDDDDDDLAGAYTWYLDDDGDGYGDDNGQVNACEEPEEDVLTSGGDCDDSDSDVNPDAVEICDDVDNDCDGTVDGPDATGLRDWYADVDSDGYGDADSATASCSEPSGYTSDDTDCDDGDASVYPGAVDWYDDGTDSDCDGTDGGVTTLPGGNAYVDGASSSLSGWAVTTCDLDADGLDDAVVSAPLAGSDYAGQVGVFYGSGVAGWGSVLKLSDADVLITGSTYGFLGYSVRCGDLDGDGLGDLVIANSEVHVSGSSIDTDWELDIFYGQAAGWTATMDQSDADVVLEQPMDAPADSAVYGNIVELADLDGDGAAEIIVLFSGGSGAFTAGEAHVVGIPGGTKLVGTTTLESELYWTWTPDSQDTFDRVRVLDDMDGDGLPDVAVFQAGWDGDETDSGQVMWTGDGSRSGTSKLGDFATASLEGQEYALYFGLTGDSGDFDGDGLWDFAVSSYGDETGTRTYPGSVYVFDDAGALGILSLGATDEADALVLGTEDNGWLCHQVRTAGDADGDGADDLYAVEYSGGTVDQGAIWLMDGAALGGTSDVDDVTLLAWEGRTADENIGREIAVGDMDGDGLPDLVVGAPYSDSGGGRIYFLLSSDW